MKYINRIAFDKLKIQWEILKARAAYFDAEQEIIGKLPKYDDSYIVSHEPMTPEEWHAYEVDGFGNLKNITPKELIKQKMDALEKQGTKLLQEEKYELFAELKEIYERYKREYDRL